MRIQLFEFCDQTWLPPSFRDSLMRALQFFLRNTNCYDSFNKLLIKNIASHFASNANLIHIAELCSGNHGGTIGLSETCINSGLNIRITATDKYPIPTNAEHQNQFTQINQSIDATGNFDFGEHARVLYTALHHFDGNQVKEMIARCIQGGKIFAAAEFTSNRAPSFLLLILSPITLWMSALFTKRRLPFSAIIFTFLIPLIPLMFLWDGVVSCLRTHSEKSLITYAKDAGALETDITIGTTRTSVFAPKISYLIVRPRRTVHA